MSIFVEGYNINSFIVHLCTLITRIYVHVSYTLVYTSHTTRNNRSIISFNYAIIHALFYIIRTQLGTNTCV